MREKRPLWRTHPRVRKVDDYASTGRVLLKVGAQEAERPRQTAGRRKLMEA